jgi:hypothetical protein
VSREEIVQFWGAGKLRRWSATAVRDLSISQRSKNYLTEVGLPVEPLGTMQFDAPAETIPRLLAQPHLRRIGLDYAVPICLNESRHGAIVWAEDGGQTPRFANANAESLGACVTLFEQYRRAVKKAGDPDALILRTEERMRAADPSALVDPENVWSSIVEQMKDGLL